MSDTNNEIIKELPESFAVLPPVFTKYGDTFTELKREGKVVIYRRDFGSGSGGCFEVVVIQWQIGKIGPKGAPLPDGEVLPSSGKWGVFGWTYLSSQLEQAEAKFLEAVKREHEKELARQGVTFPAEPPPTFFTRNILAPRPAQPAPQPRAPERRVVKRVALFDSILA